MDLNSIIVDASNVDVSTNSTTYTRATFLEFYPQFTGLVDDAIVDMYITLANSVVLESRWESAWIFGMHNFIAHYLTLYLQALDTGSGATAGQVIGNAQFTGLTASKSVGDLSISYDNAALISTASGWDFWKTTKYGFAFYNVAKFMGKAGSMVW